MPSLHPLLAAATAADPYPLYSDLRRSRPFGFDPELDAWVAADAAPVDAVRALAERRLLPGGDDPFVYRASLNTRIPLFGRPAPEAA